MKTVFLFLGLLVGSSSALATGGLTCNSVSHKKLSLDIVESSDASPVSVKLFYKTDSVDGEDGSVHSIDAKNSLDKKAVVYSSADNTLVLSVVAGSSVVSAKVDLLTMRGLAQVMIADEVKTLKITCTRE